MIRTILRYFLLCLVLSVVGKPLFMCCHPGIYGTVPLSGWWAVLWHGLPLDLAVSAYLTAGLTVLFIPGQFLSRGWRIGLQYLWFGLTALLFAVVLPVDAVLYGFWGFRIDATAIFYFISSPQDALASVSLFTAIAGIAGIAVLAVLLFLLFRACCLFADAASCRGWVVGSRNAVMVLLLAVLFLLIRGGLSVATLNTGRVFFSENMALNHAAIHPVFNLMESLSHQSGFEKQYRFMPEPEAARRFAALQERKGDSMPQLIDPNRRPHVIFVVLESFFPELMGYFEGSRHVTPCLDTLAAEGVLFTNFYANSFRTDRGLVSIFSGFPAQPATSIMKYPAKTQRLASIPKSLKDKGYRLRYYYGGDDNFTNMRSYLVAMGFEDITSEKDFPAALRSSKWGVHDHFVFDRAADELTARQEDGPVCAVIQTSSSHEPFEVPFPRRFEDIRLNACAYTDSCVGAFAASLKQSGMWEETLLVLVPDHAMQYPPDADNLIPHRYHIPMIWAGGALVPEMVPRRIGALGSQIDIAATLLAQWGYDDGAFPFSKNLLNPDGPRFAWYAFPDMMGWIKEEGWLSYDNKSQTLLHNDLGEEELKDAQAFLQTVFNYMK